MKIAVVTNNGKTVSQHFGRSRYYRIATVRDNIVIAEEIRERGTGHFAQQQNHEHDHNAERHEEGNGRHGFGAEAQSKHAMMAQEISDCNVLVAGGMGSGAYENFKSAGLDVILTDLHSIDEVFAKYIDGSIVNLYRERTD